MTDPRVEADSRVGDRGVGGFGRTAWQVVKTAGGWILRSDLALIYVAMLVGVWVWSQVLGYSPKLPKLASTNLVNMRDNPLKVLFASGFVLASVTELMWLPLLALTYAAAQRFFGRMATFIAASLGHFFATLLSVTLLVAVINKRIAPRSEGRAIDVGFSYGMACVQGMLLAVIPPRYRWWYLGALFAFWLHPMVFTAMHVPGYQRSFTDVGHACALVTGLGLSVLISARTPKPGSRGWMSRAARRD